VPGAAGCDDLLLTSMSALVRIEARSEVRFYSFSVTQSIDYLRNCKFGFQSVTARHSPRSQSFEVSTILLGGFSTVVDKYCTPELDRSIVQIFRLLVPLIVPLLVD
jgi:hypothetical protein